MQPQLYQNYNHPPSIPEINQSEPALDFQQGEKENSDTESESEQPENSFNTCVPGMSERVMKKTKIFTYNEKGQAPSNVIQNNIVDCMQLLSETSKLS